MQSPLPNGMLTEALHPRSFNVSFILSRGHGVRSSFVAGIALAAIAVIGFVQHCSQESRTATAGEAERSTTAQAYASQGPAAGQPVERRAKWGIEKRMPWNTSRVVGTPDPPDPYLLEVAFPALHFNEPLAMASIPGTNRLAIAERGGKIYTFSNNAESASKELLVDVGRTVYGLAFHPKFTTNGYVYISNVLDPANPAENGSRVSRYTASRKGGPKADAGTEQVVLSWPSGGHNGGCLRFGPDGYLYLATGDSSGIADQRLTGQDLSDLSGAILRIDVDHPAGDRAYGIPEDNPFVDREGARPEIYSYGHRQVWKFSFDPPTGRLWAGEVGQDLWEMVYLIENGGNYGWSVTEGLHPFRPERPQGPTPFIKPIVEHSHADFRSITGGYVYRADRLKELGGAYLYGDYDTGRIWLLRYDGNKVTEHRQLADTQLRAVAFGQDGNGEVYVVDFVSGRIHRLAPAPSPSADEPPFPRKLSETGLFASTKDYQPAAGLVPYSVNAELWSDGAVKDRWIAIPGDGKIEYDTVVYPQPAPGSTPGWKFPDGTVIVKTFSLQLEAGNPESLRRLETRILHHKRMPGTQEYGEQFWRGYTYIWNDEQTDAHLADAVGVDREFTITDAQVPNGRRVQKWHFPSRAECTLCHTMASKYVLGLNTLQINRDHHYGDVVANQLDTLAHLGLFDRPLPDEPKELSKLPDYRDESVPLAERARSYLHANCSHCHRKWGGGNAEFQLLATLPLDEAGILGVRPGQGHFKLNEPRLIVPGEPERSMVYHRMRIRGLGRMPHIASDIVDVSAIELIREWIEQMPRSEAPE